LEGVRELKEDLCGFREVLDLGGHGRRVDASGGSDLSREAVGEKNMYRGVRLWAKEMNEEGGSDFDTAV
jgi:hypothetical protein